MVIDLAPRLRQLRIDRHLRQEQVAQLIGVAKSTVSAYENDLRQPCLDILIRFANLYGVSVDYLIGRTDTITVNVSGLTSIDITIINQLIASMIRKNKELEELKK